MRRGLFISSFLALGLSVAVWVPPLAAEGRVLLSAHREWDAAAPANISDEVQQAQAPRPALPGTTIESINFQGNRRIPKDTLSARIFSKRGDPYDIPALQRDFMALWNTGFLEDLRLEEEDGTKGKIITFVEIGRAHV